MKDCKVTFLKQPKEAADKFGANDRHLPYEHTTEHETVRSRITGREHEISMGPQGGGLVPKNPFASLAQAGYMHANPSVLGKAKLVEFDAASKGKKLPKRVKK